jgi:UDP-N-acetylglucosamine transferase subunit ALG13
VILVSAGSSGVMFARLLAAMDEMAPRLGEPVLLQSGRETRFEARNAPCFDYVTFGTMQRLVSECRVLVGQASVGAVLMTRRFGKPLVLLPRDHTLGELVDDHQFQTARSIEGRSRMIEVVYDVAHLEAAVRRAQAKADAHLTYEPDPERDRLLAALRAALEGPGGPTA